MPTNLISRFFVGIFIGERHRGPEPHHFPRQRLGVDNLDPADYIIELSDTSFNETLTVARRVVFSILGQIAVFTGRPDGLNNLRPFNRLQPLQFFLERRQTSKGHR